MATFRLKIGSIRALELDEIVGIHWADAEVGQLPDDNIRMKLHQGVLFLSLSDVCDWHRARGHFGVAQQFEKLRDDILEQPTP